jgi:hypothetical protein
MIVFVLLSISSSMATILCPFYSAIATASTGATGVLLLDEAVVRAQLSARGISLRVERRAGELAAARLYTSDVSILANLTLSFDGVDGDGRARLALGGLDSQQTFTTIASTTGASSVSSSSTLLSSLSPSTSLSSTSTTMTMTPTLISSTVTPASMSSFDTTTVGVETSTAQDSVAASDGLSQATLGAIVGGSLLFLIVVCSAIIWFVSRACWVFVYLFVNVCYVKI